MDAGALDVADAEIEAVEKLHDGDAEHVLVGEAFGHLEGRQAAQQFSHALAGVQRPRRQREQVDKLFLQRRIFFRADGVGHHRQQLLLRDQRGQRQYVGAVAQAVADRNAFGIAGQRDHVVLAEHAGLDHAFADLRQHDAIGILVEILVAAGVLHRLQGDAADAFPGERVADDVADRVIVDAALDGRDQRGRDAVAFEIFQRLLADLAQIRAAQIDQRVALQRIELQVDLEAAFVLGQPRHEVRLARDPQAVGVDHDVADRAGAGGFQNGEEIRV